MPATTEYLSIDLSEVEDFLEVAARSPKIIHDEAGSIMESSLSVIEEQVAARTPVNLGTLRASITHEKRWHGSRLKGEIFTPLVYGLPVEKGRKAGKWPPRAAIRAWVVQKGLAPSGSKEADSIAFLIARAIGTGTTSGIMKAGKGAKMMEKGFDAAVPHVKRMWDKLPQRVITRLAR